VPQCRACLAAAGGVCRACAAATRSPGLDRDGQRAWSLGFGATVLVGEAVARLTRADGSEELVELGRAGQAAVRQRLVAIATSLGCRPDLGARVVSLAEPQPPEGTFLLGRDRDVTWEVEPAGGAALDDAVARYLPGTTGPAPRRPDRALARLLARLQDGAPPEPAPRLLAQETWRIRYLEPRGGEVWWVEEHHVAGRRPVRRELPLEFRRDDGGGRPGQRASALVPSCRIEVRRLHRSAFVDVVDAGSPARMRAVFVAGAPGVTPESEAEAAGLVEAHGLPSTAVLFVAPGSDDEPRFARPSRATLVERQVREDWTLQPGEAGRPFRGGDRGSGGGARTDVVGLDGARWVGFLAAVGALGEGSDPYTLVRHLTVTETWRGAASTTRTYVVGPGEPAYPVLDDTGRPAGDFGVDSAGHLHEPDHAWRCPVCGEHLCRACADGALVPCPACGQDACGRCRTGPPDGPIGELCDLCGVRGCARCHRVMEVRACILCGRLACQNCWDSTSCAACSDLRPMRPEEVASLPAALAARGLVVRGNTTGGATVVALAGAKRREFAVIQGVEVRRWLTLSEERNDEQALAHAVAVSVPDVPGDIDFVIDPAVPARPVERTGMELCQTSTRRWGWEVRVDGAVVAGSPAIHPLAQQSRVKAAVDAFGAVEILLPEPASPEQRQILESLVPTVDASPRAVLALTLVQERRLVELTGNGLLIRVVDDQREQVWNEVWADGLGSAAPLVADWGLEPDKVLHAVTSDVAVCLARIGATVVCAVEVAGARRLYGVGDDEIGVAMLCDVLGVPRSDLRVGATIRPGRLVPPTIRGGELLDRDVAPTWLRRKCEPNNGAVAGAVRLWVRKDALGPLADLAPLDGPEELVGALRDAVGRGGVPTQEGIVGLRVRERWRVGELDREVEYLVAVHGPARVLAEDTGELAHELRFDRAAHLAADPRTCAYCSTVTCRLCRDGVESCGLCGIDVCGRCAPAGDEMHRCHACRSLVRLGRMRRLVLRDVRGPALIGEDDVHRVVFVAGRDGPYLKDIRRGSAPSVRALALNRAQQEALNRAASETWFTGG
jgi:hypothetical protein